MAGLRVVSARLSELRATAARPESDKAFSGEDAAQFAKRQVRCDDQRRAFVALGDDLEDELGGAVWERE